MKIFLSLLVATGVSIAHSQTAITQLTDAAHSRGYISWVPVDNAKTYQIAFYDRSNPGSISLLLTTSSSFIKVDPSVFRIPNLAYKITALNFNNSVVGTSTPIVNAMPIGDPIEYEDICEKECDGTSYAYTMKAHARKVYDWGLDENGQPNYHLATVQLYPDDAYAYENEEDGTWVPFYQPIDANVWTNTIPSNHPYKQNINHQYDKVYLPANHVGVYLDATNAAVSSGWLVPKRFDQFSPFHGVSTVATADASMDVCSAPIGGVGLTWINFFNEHHDFVPYETANAFVGYEVTSLACHEAFEYEAPEGGGEGDDEGDIDEWFDELIADFAKEHDGEGGEGDGGGIGTGTTVTWREVLGSLADVSASTSPNGDFVTNVIYTNIHDNSQVAVVYRDANNAFAVNPRTPDLSAGLYTVTALTNNGKILPYYTDIAYSVPAPSLNDVSTLVVTPNPVVDQIVNFEVSSAQAASGVYFIHDINGTELATGSVSVAAKSTQDVSVDLSNVRISSYNVILSVLFNDGSALQQLVEIQP